MMDVNDVLALIIHNFSSVTGCLFKLIQPKSKRSQWWYTLNGDIWSSIWDIQWSPFSSAGLPCSTRSNNILRFSWLFLIILRAICRSSGELHVRGGGDFADSSSITIWKALEATIRLLSQLPRSKREVICKKTELFLVWKYQQCHTFRSDSSIVAIDIIRHSIYMLSTPASPYLALFIC